KPAGSVTEVPVWGAPERALQMTRSRRGPVAPDRHFWRWHVALFPALEVAPNALDLRGSTQHPPRSGSIGSGGCAVEWISDEAKARIAELWAEGAPAWVMREEAGVSRHAVLRQIRRLQRRPKREPTRSPMR